MKITTEHPSSSYGMPVILDYLGRVMTYKDGIKTLRRSKGLSVKDLGAICGVSYRTVQGWESGKFPSASAMNALSSLLVKTPASQPD